jgi:hypothetical protein
MFFRDTDKHHLLHIHNEFQKVTHGGYFVEWACGADLSVDTIEARWRVKAAPQTPS